MRFLERFSGIRVTGAGLPRPCFLFFFLILLLVSCRPVGSLKTTAPAATLPNTALLPASRTPLSTLTLTPSRTPHPSQTPRPTTTPTPTPTLHPMDIRAARLMPYPGSDIVIEKKLEPGSNYNRYIAWYESEGLRIYGLLTIPFGNKPPEGWPAIVFNHGYIHPEVYRSTQLYYGHVDLLAISGYIVFRVDCRGHDRSEGEAVGAYGHPGYTTDVLNAVGALKRFPQVNAQKIGMWGHSQGGFLTLRAMTISTDIRAGVIWAGVVGTYPDLLCCWLRETSILPTPTSVVGAHFDWRASWQENYGSPAENPGFWQGISANTYLKDLSGAVQLHHGTGDTIVPVAFSQKLYEQILQAGNLVEYYEYEGDDHNLEANFSLAMARTLMFFEQYLKGAD